MSFWNAPQYTVADDSELEVYDNFAVEFREKSHRFWLHHSGARIPVPSVTTVLRVLDKPALAYWIEDQATRGAVQAERLGELAGVHEDDWCKRVRSLDLGASAKRDAGADRGAAVHSVLEFWAREEAVPNLSDFPAEVRGYVQGLCGWLLAARPKPTSVERFVGSVEHLYAGRMDMRALIDGADTLVDLKSSPRARIYAEGHAQARGYALADVECGNPEPDRIIIVGVGAEGDFVVEDCRATTDDWLAILDAYYAMARLRAEVKKAA